MVPARSLRAVVIHGLGVPVSLEAWELLSHFLVTLRLGVSALGGRSRATRGLNGLAVAIVKKVPFLQNKTPSSEPARTVT